MASLYDALATCTTVAEMQNLLKDVLSAKELAQAEVRWKIAEHMLDTGCSQRAARQMFGASQDQVKRITMCLGRRNSGYRKAHRQLWLRANPGFDVIRS